MPRKFLDRKRKRRGEYKPQKLRNQVGTSQEKVINTSKNDDRTDLCHHNKVNSTSFLNKPITIPIISPNRIILNLNTMSSPDHHSHLSTRNELENQKENTLPTSIELNKTSSSISTITTSHLNLPSFHSTSDASSSNLSCNHSLGNLDVSSEEKSRRLQLFSKKSDSSEKSAYNRKRRLII